MIHNEKIDMILSRKSVRRFSAALSDEELETLLHAAMSAPTAMDYQPWHFVVVNDNATKENLRSFLPYAKMINENCTGIVVCGDISLYEEVSKRDGEDNTLYWVEDCSAASENLLLAAHALGLGAVWTGIFPLESRISKLRETLALPENIVPLNLILAGHVLSEGRVKDKWDTSKIHYEKF
ncbi:MAG: nitroreductase family protein [Bacteroidales bacterium]|nr:nitroreductase family protein [Bacteroidales bacterium]